jgi:DNA-binding NarL/FixJ family response regulator
MNLNLCIVEDDPRIRSLTAEIINKNPSMRCDYTFSSAEEFLNELGTIHFDYVLMDIGLPGISGTECVSWCTANNKKIDFIMYTTHCDSVEVFGALRAGAKGYILKSGDPNKLIEGILEMADGGSPMSPKISRMVANSFAEMNQPNDNLQKLSLQEWEVLKGLNQGLSYKEIASKKFVSCHTVRAQIRSIYEKLHVHNKVDAIKLIKGDAYMYKNRSNDFLSN